MSLRQPSANPAPKPIRLAEVFAQIRVKGFNSSGVPVKMLAEDDGTQRFQSILYHSGTTQIRQKAETDGSVIVSNYGKASGTLTAFGVEATTGELRVVLNGKDEAANIDSVRTDPNRILWTRPYDGLVQLDPVLIPSSEGVLLDGSASLTASGVYEVWFNVSNIDGTNAVSVDVGVDIGAGGSLSGAEYWLKSTTVPAGGRTGWTLGGVIGADDDVRGVAGAANDAAIQFWVRRVDTGA